MSDNNQLFSFCFNQLDSIYTAYRHFITHCKYKILYIKNVYTIQKSSENDCTTYYENIQAYSKYFYLHKLQNTHTHTTEIIKRNYILQENVYYTISFYFVILTIQFKGQLLGILLYFSHLKKVVHED